MSKATREQVADALRCKADYSGMEPRNCSTCRYNKKFVDGKEFNPGVCAFGQVLLDAAELLEQEPVVDTAEVVVRTLTSLGVVVDPYAKLKDRILQEGKKALLQKYAALFSGRHRGDEVSIKEQNQLRDDGVVFLFGYSNYCAEFVGAIDRVVSIFGSDEPMLIMKSNDITAQIDKDGVWTFNTEIPSVGVEIYDGNFLFCRALLFIVTDGGTVKGCEEWPEDDEE